VADDAFAPNLDPERIEDHHGVHPVQRPLLPRRDFVEHCIRERADQIGRGRGLVQVLEMALGCPGPSASGIQ